MAQVVAALQLRVDAYADRTAVPGPLALALDGFRRELGDVRRQLFATGHDDDRPTGMATPAPV